MIKTTSITVTFQCEDCKQKRTFTILGAIDRIIKIEAQVAKLRQEFDLTHYCPQHQERTGFARNH